MYVSLIFTAVFVGYSNGIGPVFSYHYGAQDHEELKNLRKRSLEIIAVTSVSMFVFSELLARPYSLLFLQNAEDLLPPLFGVDGIWYSVVFAELMAAVVGTIFMAALRRKYQY